MFYKKINIYFKTCFGPFRPINEIFYFNFSTYPPTPKYRGLDSGLGKNIFEGQMG